MQTKWRHLPEVPLQVSPVFRRPFRAGDVAQWIPGRWAPITERPTRASPVLPTARAPVPGRIFGIELHDLTLTAATTHYGFEGPVVRDRNSRAPSTT